MAASNPSIPEDRKSGVRLKGASGASDHVDVLIIGAGPGGLATALHLARAGLRVRILERSSRIGGRTSALKAEGFRFDLGPTFFHYPASLEALFRSVGRRLSDELSLVRLDPSYRVQFGSSGKSLLCAPDLAQMERAIAEIAPEDARNIGAYLEENRLKWEVLRPLIERPQNSWRDWLPTVVKHAALLRPWKSMDADHRRHFKDERIRRAFSFQSKYFGMSPFDCPAMFSFHSAIEHDPGIYHPIGGCSAIPEAMARVARDMNVEICLDEEVQAILFEGRKAVGVRTREGECRADAVVINADFAHAMANLVPDELRKKWSNKNMEKKRYSCSTFMMYLGIEGRYDDVAHHTVYLPDDYERHLREIETLHVPSELPSFYVQNASITDESLAPRGKSALYVLVPTTHQHPNVDWNRERARYRDLVLAQLPKIGITGVEKRIRYERVITPLDWSQSHAIHRGAVFNLAHNMSQMLSRRPRNQFDELDAVYLVGGGTHPGSGLFAIFESAKISARQLLESRGMSTSWMNAEEPLALPPAAEPRRLVA